MAIEPEYGPAGSQNVPPAEPRPTYAAPPGHTEYTQRPYTPQAGGGLSSNVAAGLAYVTIIPAIIFLVLDPYKRDPLVRFHSWQSIFLGIFAIVLQIVEGFLFTFLPAFASLALSSLIGLAIFAIWLIAMIQAFQGRMWQIPVIGGFAAAQSTGRPAAL